MFAVDYIKQFLSSNLHVNSKEISEIRTFCNQPKEEHTADKVRQVHAKLKNTSNFELCYYYISNEYGYRYIIELIITGNAIYRLETSENEIILERWSRGDEVGRFATIKDLLLFLFPDVPIEQIQRIE
jgi:hypothetical protein